MGNRHSRANREMERVNAALTEYYRGVALQLECEEIEGGDSGEENSFVLVRKRQCQDLPPCSQRQLPKIQVQLKLSTYLPEITSNQLIKHLEDANFQFSKHWEDLTRRLNIDIDDRNKQRVQIGINSDYKRALEELLSVWISSDENATWEILIDTVHIYEPKCAENMQKQLGLFPTDVSTKLQQQCDLHLLTCVNLNLQPQSFHQLAPYFLSHSELEKIEEYDESQRMLKTLQHWRDCRGRQATYEALICIFRNALESSEALTDLIVTHVVNPSQARQTQEAAYNPPSYTSLSDDQVLNLRKEHESIKNKFATFYFSVARSLITANANSDSFFTDLQLFLMARSSTPVNYQSVRDVNSLLQAVIGESSWFNFRIFEEIIEQFGQAADKEKLEVYRKELSAYLNKSILKLPNRVSAGSELEHRTTVYLKIPDNEDKLPDLYGLDVMCIKQKLGEHIGVHESKIQFVEYRLGCIEVVFSVPNSRKSCMSNVEWDTEREGYRVCVDLLSILPMDFCGRNQELTESLQKSRNSTKELSTTTVLSDDSTAASTSFSMCCDES